MESMAPCSLVSNLVFKIIIFSRVALEVEAVMGLYLLSFLSFSVLVYGSALLTHCILGAGLKDTLKIGAGVDIEEGLSI